MTPLAPIVLFVYNRPSHTLNLLRSLRSCKLSDQSKLIVYADGPKRDASEDDLEKINEVRKIVKSEKWCMEVTLIEKQHNLGLADSIVNGITEVIQQAGKIIVLEDDLDLSPGFLEYLNGALTIYQDEEKVMHVTAYMYPVKEKLPELFFLNTTSCWGWATWKRAWQSYNSSATELLQQLNSSERLSEFTFNGAAPFYQHLEANVHGKLNTWAIKWHTSVFLQRGFCLHPHPGLSRNTGNDGSGTHGTEPIYNNQRITDSIRVKKIPLAENNEARKSIETFYRNLSKRKNIFERIINRFL